MFDQWVEVFSQHPWLGYGMQIVVLILGAWLLRTVVMRRLRRWAERTTTDVDDQIVALLDRALTPLLALAVLAASLNLFALPPRLLVVINRVIYLSALGLALYFAFRFLLVLLDGWLLRSPSRESLRQPVTLLARVVFAVFGVMIVADNLGISLTAVWTTLGVGSVAVALALQDTLSNFFAGMYIRLDGPVRVGDYVKLDTGDEGFVSELGWRSARIRTLPNNTVVVPNAKLASGRHHQLLPAGAANVAADPDWGQLQCRSLTRGGDSGGRSEACHRQDRGAGRRPRAFRALHSGVWRVIPGFHADLPRQHFRRPISGAA